MKMSKKIFASLLTMVMMLVMASSVFAAGMSSGSTQKAASYQDMDAITEMTIDYTQSAQIPLDGWYSKTFEDGRTVKMYFPEYATCRAYFTVVAAPAGVKDVQAWADKMGFTELMEERGEILAILEADKKWKDLDTELAYVTEAMNFLKSGRNANNVAMFANYGCFYLVGYEGGAAPMEAWSAENPIWVVSQAFISGRSAGSSYLKEVGAKTYDARNSVAFEGEELSRGEVPVPTWFVNYSSFDASVRYWKSANDCKMIPNGMLLSRTYWQTKDSDALSTEYPNECTTENHGISQVKMSYALTVKADALADFLYDYTRYNTSYAYSNALGERMEYTGVRVAAQAAAQSAEYLTEEQKMSYGKTITAADGKEYDGYYVLAREQADAPKGMFESGIFAYSDDNNDGVMDAREYLMYIPDSAKGTKAPVMLQMPGGGQSSAVGFDSTQWWRVADEEGLVVIVLNEAYNNGVALTWKNADMAYYAMTDLLAKKVDGVDVDIDWSRIYASGHSQGSLQSHLLATQHPEFYAAVGTTSGIGGDGTGVNKVIPAMMISGEFDMPDMIPSLFEGQAKFQNWAKYLIHANGCLGDLEGGYAEEEWGRTSIYSWSNEQGISLFKWGQTHLREHNCVPADIPKLWDFVSKFSKDENGDRYYSESGFEKNDSVKIEKKEIADEEIESLQGFTTLTWYGQQLYKVEVTYKNDVSDIRVNASDFRLMDRGYSNPAFGMITITDVEVDKNVVTLYTNVDTAATGERSKNPLGLACTGPWYYDKDGTLFYGRNDDDEFENNTTGKGYQARATLELKFFYNGQSEEDALCLADEKGQYTAVDGWLPSDNGIWDEFKDLEDEVKIPSTTGIEGDYVRAKFFAPEEAAEAAKNGSDEKFPLVVSMTGTGTSYWDLNDGITPDTTNNYGVNLNFDGTVYRWVEAYKNGGTPVIAMSIHDRQVYEGSMAEGTDYKFWEDDKAVIEYMIEHYNADPDRIIFTGNSGGTGRTSKINAEYPGLIDVFISNNGFVDRGWLDPETGGWDGIFTEEDWREVAESGMAIWSLVGQTDGVYASTIQKNLETIKGYYLDAGYSEEWFEDNFHYTLYPSSFYKYWGESDHSSTKMTYWYFFDQIYRGPDAEIVNGELVYKNALNPGDTYEITEGVKEAVEGFKYPVYDQSVMEWALSREKKAKQDLQQQVTSIQATTVPNFYGHKVSTVEITFAEDTDAAALAEATFTLYDRGSANPQFGEVKVTDVKVEGNTVILTVDQ
ncbi:MAG: PHB depolymerase family esterase, partial [Clostridiales bacterium]|nr:PHB depolymerase family esterase [Clostridiales bacterium]